VPRKAVQSFSCSSVAYFSREYVKQRLEKNPSVQFIHLKKDKVRGFVSKKLDADEAATLIRG